MAMALSKWLKCSLSLPTHYEWWEQTIRTLALVHFYLFIVESLTQRFSGHQIRWLMVIFFFFSFCFFCVYHSFVFISHPSAVSFLFLVSGETTVVALTLTLCFRHSDFGVCVCFGYCACFTSVLSNCMMIFTAFYEHLPISFISLRKSQDNLRLFGSSWSTRWRYVRAGSRIRCTCWTHEHINAYKYERWERENKFYTHIKLFLLKVLSLLWIQHIKWYLRSSFHFGVYRWMALQKERMKNQMENIRFAYPNPSRFGWKRSIVCALCDAQRNTNCAEYALHLGFDLHKSRLRIYLRLRRKLLPLLVFIELFGALFVHRFTEN